MSTELINKNTGEIVEQKGFTDEQIQLLKSTVCKDHTNEEFAVFLNVCKRVQLDPFAKQIYSIKYSGRMTTQTSIDGLRLIADRTGRYAPGRAPTFTYDKDGKLESATAYIMKLVGDKWFEVGSTAIMKEYQNAFNQLWQKLPHAMLSKCAEATALRRAFPNETSGLYSTEEMSQSAEQRPTIQMPRAKTDSSTTASNARDNREIRTSNEEGLESNVERNSAVIEDNTENGIEWGEPESEKEKIEEKVKQEFGKGSAPITVKQRAMIFARMKQAKIPETVMRAHLKDTFGVESTENLTRDNMDDILAWIMKFEGLNEASN